MWLIGDHQRTLSKHEDLFAHGPSEEYMLSALTWAKESAPTKRVTVNESGIFGGADDLSYNRERYFDLLKTLIGSGAPRRDRYPGACQRRVVRTCRGGNGIGTIRPAVSPSRSLIQCTNT